MAHANWAFRQVFGDRDSTEEPADGAPRLTHMSSHCLELAGRRLSMGTSPVPATPVPFPAETSERTCLARRS